MDNNENNQLTDLGLALNYLTGKQWHYRSNSEGYASIQKQIDTTIQLILTKSTATLQV